MQEELPRRRYLAVTGAAMLGAVSAGCGEDGSPGDGSTPTATAASSPTGTADWVETTGVDMTDDLTFEPERIRVATGATVTWENVGSIGHTVTAYEDRIPEGASYFASGGYGSQSAADSAYSEDGGGNVPAGETYSHTFETAGSYEYYCIPHELNGMVGSISVR